MKVCNICNEKINEFFYKSSKNRSITSLGEIYPQRTLIYQCLKCSHIQTESLHDIEKYYDQSYKILIKSEEEDQLYVNKKGDKFFRIDHQVEVFLSKINLDQNMKIMDYGCGKASTLRKLKEKNPTIHPYVFDVSKDYIDFWKKFIPSENWSVHTLPLELKNSFDIVTNFFSLEHVESPNIFMKNVFSLLKNEGKIYGVVPNMYENIGDFVVVDHVNHFSTASLWQLLKQNGFTNIKIDDFSHYGAYVFSATKSCTSIEEITPEYAVDFYKEAEKIKIFWSEISAKIEAYEDLNSDRVKAIYGSGFYGAFIASTLKNMEKVVCFIDQNPHRHGLIFFEKEIIAPENLPANITSILVGLNPQTAEKNLQDLKKNWPADIDYFVL
jgi:SAM-dependent methyltransferase